MGTRFFGLTFVLAIAACASPFEGVERDAPSSSAPPSLSAPGSAPETAPPSTPGDPAPAPAPAPAPSAPASPPPPAITGIVIDSLDECVEKTTSYMGSSTITVKLDTEQRVIAEYLNGKTLWGYRYAADKKLIAVAYWSPSSNPSAWDAFQRDFTYDASGHLEASSLSYATSPPFYSPATSTAASGNATAYTNTYGQSGALAKSVVVPTTSSWGTAEFLFVENATTNRCDEVELRHTYPNGPTLVHTEKRTYDAGGRISRADKYGLQRCGLAGDALGTSTKKWSYDAQGRLTNASFWCREAKLTDPPNWSKTIEYFADGSQRVEVIDRTNDVGPPGAPVVTERSAYCADIDTWRGGERRALRPTTTRCVAAE